MATPDSKLDESIRSSSSMSKRALLIAESTPKGSVSQASEQKKLDNALDEDKEIIEEEDDE